MSSSQSSAIKVLIAYGTNEGQTARIAEYLADILRGHGLAADTLDLKRGPIPHLENYDGVIVGGSVHLGKHQPRVRSFVRENRTLLDRLPSAFFSVSMAAQDRGSAGRKEVVRYLFEFAHETGWRPIRVATFAGAVPYTRYGFFTRWIMRRIARSKGSPDLDTSRDYEYTDWEQVKRFGEEFLSTLVPAETLQLAG